jgi:hypothetical protein
MDDYTRVRHFGSSYQVIFPFPDEPAWCSKDVEKSVIPSLHKYYEGHKKPLQKLKLKVELPGDLKSDREKIIQAVKEEYEIVE